MFSVRVKFFFLGVLNGLLFFLFLYNYRLFFFFNEKDKVCIIIEIIYI